MSKNIIYLNENNFNDEVINSNQLVLVDFYADWCMPCKMLAPTLEELADDNAGVVKIAKLNVDIASTLAARYGISGIPNVLFFKNGAVVESIVGVRGKEYIQNAIDKLQ